MDYELAKYRLTLDVVITSRNWEEPIINGKFKISLDTIDMICLP